MALILPGDSLVSISNPKPDAPAYRAWHTDGFYMDVAEVTNAEYARFVAAAGAKPPPHWGAVRPPEGAAGLPVVCVTCEEAAAYAAWAGKRLPTDAEWERAARGPSGRLYPWGETFTGAEAVLAREPLPPGSRPADKTEEGCLDMGGNVSEWTADDTPAPSAVSEDKSISRSSLSPPRQARPFKVVRGASWAGLERDRTERFVPLNAATAKSDPARIVLVDMPGLRGIEARAFVETAFFYRATVNDTPVIEIRRWIPELRRTVSGSFEIQPGREIAGERTVPFGMEQGAATRRIQLATGCRLIRVLNPDDPTGQRIEYTDSEGRTQEMARIPKRPGDAAKIEEFLPGSDEIRIPDAIVRELYGRSVNAAVRNNARLFAPGDGRYINCGFRCAKDLP
jgi:formylglycine-generating enzyme required for sulfatase activity